MKKAFTLVELLVVIAVIGILASLLLPALSQAKGKAQAVGCANNIRHLSVAWLLYADDSADTLVNNHGIDETKQRQDNWVNNVLDWGASDGNTNLEMLTTGKLSPYLGGSTAVYKCRSDKSMAANGSRIRSYAMNSLVGDPGVLTNRFNPTYVQFFRLTQIPNPSQIYVFLDEHPDTINDGFFMNRWDEYKWGNLPASYHNRSGNFSFADGHSERRKWEAGGTIRPAVQGGVGGTIDALPPTDFEWMRQRTSVKRD